MAFCKSCGAELTEGTKFCQACGASVEEGSTTSNVNAGINNDDVANNKAFAILAYFGILWLIPLLAAKDSKFAQFHANQGLVLFLSGFVLGLIFLIPILGWIAGFVGYILLIVFEIMGIVSAAKGEEKELPIIGGIHILK